MKIKVLLGWSSALCLSALIAQAQETNETQKLQQQLKDVQEHFEKQQQEMRENLERMMREQQAQIEALKQQIAIAATNAPSAPATNAIAGDVEDLKQRVDDLTTASKRTSVNQFNPGIGFVGDTIFSYTSKGQAATGSARPGGYDVFMRTAELNLEASVDPFVRAYGVIAASADPVTGEANLGVEEASVVTTSLPWNLTAQGGRFFADFGRLSYVHDHDLPFVFRPLVLDRYIGGESRTDGIQVNYLFPTAHVFDSHPGRRQRLWRRYRAQSGRWLSKPQRAELLGHLSTYFDLTPNISLETGVSGLVDDKAQGFLNMPDQRNRYIAGADITLRYQPLTSTVYRGFVWAPKYSITPPPSTTRLAANTKFFWVYSYLETKLSRRDQDGISLRLCGKALQQSRRDLPRLALRQLEPQRVQLLRLQIQPHRAQRGHRLEKFGGRLFAMVVHHRPPCAWL